jgi:hypothetical protein
MAQGLHFYNFIQEFAILDSSPAAIFTEKGKAADTGEGFFMF